MLGELLSEYKETRENIACLSSCIRRATGILKSIDELLYDPEKAGRLAEAIKETDLSVLSQTEEWVKELQVALKKKQDLKTGLDNAGYRDIIQL